MEQKDINEGNRTTRWITYAIIAGIVLIVVSICGSCSYRATLRAEMVKNGANPIDVMCMDAAALSMSESLICADRAKR